MCLLAACAASPAPGSCCPLELPADFFGCSAQPGVCCLELSQGRCRAGSIGRTSTGLLVQPMARLISLPAGLFPAHKRRGQGTPRPLCFPINEHGPCSLPVLQGWARVGPFCTWHMRWGKYSFPRGVPGVLRRCRLLLCLSLSPARHLLPAPCLPRADAALPAGCGCWTWGEAGLAALSKQPRFSLTTEQSEGEAQVSLGMGHSSSQPQRSVHGLFPRCGQVVARDEWERMRHWGGVPCGSAAS